MRFLRKWRILLERVDEKELRYDQKRMVENLVRLTDYPRTEIETAIFEVGVMTIVGVALNKVPDSLNLKEDDWMWQLVQAAGKAARAGAQS